jgi:hypothetical protein
LSQESELSSADKITMIFDGMKDVVLYKNANYGDSALNPMRLFAKDITSDASIRIRLDDKLKRIYNGTELRKNDVADIIGYLVLLCASKGWTYFDDLKD